MIDKPCQNFATNNCEYGEECWYKHIVLKPGEHLCYQCGDIFERKSTLLNHIRNFHNDPCLKYLEGKCTYGRRCIYKHTEIVVQDVVRTPRNANSYEDFPQLPPTEKKTGGKQKFNRTINVQHESTSESVESNDDLNQAPDSTVKLVNRDLIFNY